jgi:hypothetical protein
MGLVSDLRLVQLRLCVLVCIVYVLLSIPLAYYVMSRSFIFTYFGSPATYGMLTSERFATLDWWTTYCWVFAWFPVLWVGTFMLLNFRVKGYKIAFIVYLSVSLAVWLSTFVIHCIWMRQRNDPTFPNNPANSYRSCCTPEFYNVVPTCPNFGSAAPECNPPIALAELGSNGDFALAFCFNISLIVLWSFFLYFTIEFMKLMDKYAATGGDASYLKKQAPPPPNPPEYTAIPTYLPPAAGPSLVDVKKTIASRVGTGAPFQSK